MALDTSDHFTAWRKDGGPTLYLSHKTSVTADILEAGLIFASLILAFSFVILLPGYFGRRIIYTVIRITVGLFVTSSILICNFGQQWETATVYATTQYRAGIREEIHADVGLHVGLRSINVTLKGHPEKVSMLNGTLNETINYNERFSWDNLGFTQGRLGFGPNAGQFNQEFRQAQLRGAPYPILWVAEYFTLDGEGIRWGRYFRQAGYFTHIIQWTAFPLWILAVICLHGVKISYGAYLSIGTGLILCIANCIYAYIRNPLELAIPINSEAVLVLKWGWSFYLNLVTAGICLFIGIVIFIMDCVCPKRISSILNVGDFYNAYPRKDVDVIVVQPLYRRLTTMFLSPTKVAPIEDLEIVIHTQQVHTCHPEVHSSTYKNQTTNTFRQHRVHKTNTKIEPPHKTQEQTRHTVTENLAIPGQIWF